MFGLLTIRRLVVVLCLAAALAAGLTLVKNRAGTSGRIAQDLRAAATSAEKTMVHYKQSCSSEVDEMDCLQTSARTAERDGRGSLAHFPTWSVKVVELTSRSATIVVSADDHRGNAAVLTRRVPLVPGEARQATDQCRATGSNPAACDPAS